MVKTSTGLSLTGCNDVLHATVSVQAQVRCAHTSSISQTSSNARNANFALTAQRRRVTCLQDLLKAEEQHIHHLQEGAAPLRAAWASWNPQRAAAAELAASVASGATTLQECFDARNAYFRALEHLRQGSKAAQELPGAASTSYQHPAPFRWPAPKGVEVRCKRMVWDRTSAVSAVTLHSISHSPWQTSCWFIGHVGCDINRMKFDLDAAWTSQQFPTSPVAIPHGSTNLSHYCPARTYLRMPKQACTNV